EQSSAGFDLGTTWEGDDFSRAENAGNLGAALAAEGGFRMDGSVPSGAKAPESLATSDGAAGSRALSKLYDEPSEADRYQMIRTYFQMLIEEELPDAVGKMKQFASWFTHGVPGGAGLRKAIYEAKSAVEILGRVEEFFEGRLQLCDAGARED